MTGFNFLNKIIPIEDIYFYDLGNWVNIIEEGGALVSYLRKGEKALNWIQTKGEVKRKGFDERQLNNRSYLSSGSRCELYMESLMS